MVDWGTIRSLVGWAQRPEMVPQYLNRVSRGEEFEGASFGSLKVEFKQDDSREAYKFRIGNRESKSS